MSFDVVQSVKVEAVIPRLVVCEFCATEYVYEMKCSHEVSASILKYGVQGAEREAVAWGEKLIRDQVTYGCEPVPCPKCYRFQRQMSEHLGTQKYQWLLFLLVPLLLAGGLSLAVALFADDTRDRLSALGVIVGSAGGFLALMKLSDRLAKRYDANLGSEAERVAVASERAFLTSAFRQYHAERLRVAYQSHLQEAAGADEPPPFVVDVWLKEDALTTGRAVAVALPTGGTAHLDLDESLDTGATYQLRSTAGEDIPFVARVCVFNRTPVAV